MMNTNLAEKLTIVRVPVKELKASAYNPRKWDEKAIADMKESITRFGLVDPLLVNGAPERKNVVIGGHLRLKVATLLGFTEVPVVYLTIPDIEKEKELNLRLNKNVGAWDEELLKAFDTNLLLDVGFTPDELNGFFDDVLEIADDGFNIEEELAKIVTPETKPGDLYQLGDHRLLCGNSLDPKDVMKLMGGDRANMVFSDPPYNINLDYRKGIGTKGKYTTDKLVDDNKGTKEYEKFLDDAIANALTASNPDAHIFFWCDEKYVWLLQTLYEKHGVRNRRLCFWVKNNFDPTPQVAFNKVIELCVYGTRGNPRLNPALKNLSEIMNKETNSIGLYDDLMSIVQLWLVKRDATTDYEHPTQKPITLCEKPIKRCSAPGEIILDLFGGSGSTLIAAEQLKRRAYLVELDPTFCDVIVLGLVYAENDPEHKGDHLDQELLICDLTVDGEAAAFSRYGMSVAMLSGLIRSQTLFEDFKKDEKLFLKFKDARLAASFAARRQGLIDGYAILLGFEAVFKKLSSIYETDMAEHVAERLAALRQDIKQHNEAVQIGTGTDEGTQKSKKWLREEPMAFEKELTIDVDAIEPDKKIIDEHEAKLKEIFPNI